MSTLSERLMSRAVVRMNQLFAMDANKLDGWIACQNEDWYWPFCDYLTTLSADELVALAARSEAASAYVYECVWNLFFNKGQRFPDDLDLRTFESYVTDMFTPVPF